MMLLLVLCSSLLTFLSMVSCTSASREGLPADSPFIGTSSTGEQLLPYGTAVGDITSRSAVLWVRTEGLKAVQVEWASVEAWKTLSAMATLRSSVSRTAVMVTGPYTDFTLSISLADLTPGTRYRYHILVDDPDRSASSPGTVAATGEFATPPDEDRPLAVTFAWSGDLGGQERCRQGEAGYPIFDIVHAQHPDFFLFLGDTMYADGVCPSPPNAPGADFIAKALPEYRAKHRYQRGAAALRRLLSVTPVYVVWDDHEVTNNFSGPFEGRTATARQALREYWPMQTFVADPSRMYRSVRYGADLELLILDTRSYRSRNADPDGPTKTMLGAAQLDWLLGNLRRSTATWKVVVTSVPLSIPKGGGQVVPGFDGWAGGTDGTGFERERQIIVDLILRERIKNVVFLAGDVHYVQANRYDPDGDGHADFSEFIVGPLSAAPGRMTPPSSALHPTTLIHEGGFANFGVVRVASRTFEVLVIDDAGTMRFRHLLQAE